MAVKVLFIAGAGRSGTTFLSLMLAQHRNTQNVGQIRDLPKAFGQSDSCSCDLTVPECAFWGPVVARFEARHGKGALASLPDGLAQFRKAAGEDTNWQDETVRARLARNHAPFLDQLGTLYEAASGQARDRMLVDSSKTVELAFALSLIPGIDLFVLNLVRDPRAVTVSWAKRLKRKNKLRHRTRNWVVRQRRLQVMKRHNPEKFMLLRYEDLTARPKHWIAEIQDRAGLERDTSLFTDDTSATISWDRVHLFPPANETVLKERKTEIAIKQAEGWRQEKNAGLHALAERLTFPYAEKFGYKAGANS